MPKKRYVRGDRAFKSLINRLPEAVKQEMIVDLNLLGRSQLAKAKSAVPVKSGDLRTGLDMKVLPNSLKLKVGLLTKATNKRLFYGHIVEFGRKASVVNVVRGGYKSFSNVQAAGGRSNNYKRLAVQFKVPGAYKLNVKATPARHFLFTTTREELNRPFVNLWTKALARASAGVTDG